MSVKKGFLQRRSILRIEGGAKRLRRALGEMKAVRIFWEIMLFALCSASLLSFGSSAEASSASVTVETKNDKVHVGDTVYVVVTVRSAKAIRGFEGYFAYDHQYLRFESGGGVVHGNDDAFRILDMERAAGSTKLKYSVKFTARKAGGTSITLRKPYNVLEDDGNNTKMSVSHNALNMMIAQPGVQTVAPRQKAEPTAKPSSGKKNQNKKKPAEGKSSPIPSEKPKKDEEKTGQKDVLGSSKLRSLEIQGTQLTPEFSPDIEKYSGVISTSKEELPVIYEAEDSHATVKVSGNKKIKDGKNVFKISVKNSDGKKTTYRLSMTVQKITPEEDSENSRVNVMEKSGKMYMVGTTTLCVGEAEAEKIPQGFERISIDLEGKKVICYAQEGDREADYVLIYGEEEQAFYLYDRKSGSLQSYEKVKMWYQSNGEREISTSASLEEKLESYRYVLAIMGTFCVLMLILMLYFALHSRRYGK